MSKFINAIKKTLRETFTISGRANRRDFWCWLILCGAILMICNFIDGSVIAPAQGFLPNEDGATQYLTIAAFLLLAVPTATVTIRRLHDRNWSGWWILLAIIPFLIFYFFDQIILSITENGILTFEENYELLEILFAWSTAPLAFIGLLAIVCALKGTKGPNKYGEAD